jgi:hypothetical protein
MRAPQVLLACVAHGRLQVPAHAGQDPDDAADVRDTHGLPLRRRGPRPISTAARKSWNPGATCRRSTWGIECDMLLTYNIDHTPPTSGMGAIRGGFQTSGGDLSTEATRLWPLVPRVCAAEMPGVRREPVGGVQLQGPGLLPFVHGTTDERDRRQPDGAGAAGDRPAPVGAGRYRNDLDDAALEGRLFSQPAPAADRAMPDLSSIHQEQPSSHRGRSARSSGRTSRRCSNRS